MYYSYVEVNVDAEIWRVTVDLTLCDGNGVCAVEAPGVFDLSDDDALVVLKDHVGTADLPLVRRAVLLCPKRALSLVDGEK